MNKDKYLNKLRRLITRLPKDDQKRVMDFYNELIDDKLEAGKTEEDILAEFGAPEQLAVKIFAENGLKYTPPNTSARILKLCAIVLGSPIWISLLAAFLVIALAFLICLWAVMLCLWSCVLAFGVAAVGGLCSSVLMLIYAGNVPAAFFQIGASLLCGGLGVLTYIASIKLTLFMASFTKSFCVGIYHFFMGKKANYNV